MVEYKSKNDKSYNINLNSSWRFLFVFLVLFIGMALMWKEIVPVQEVSIMIFILKVNLILASSFFCGVILSKAKVSITLTDSTFQHTYDKPFLLGRKKGFVFKWSEIESFVFEKDKFYDSFRLNLKDDRVYEISKIKFFGLDDDFMLFEKELPNFLKGQINNNLQSPIIRGKTIFQDPEFIKIFKILFVVCAVIILVNILYPTSSTSVISIVILASNLLYVFFKILEEKKS